MASSLSNFELKVEEYNDECGICSDTFQELAARKDLVVTSCGHKFSRIAITDWLKVGTTCPTCQTDIRNKKLVEVTLTAHKIAKDLMPAASPSASGMGLEPAEKSIDRFPMFNGGLAQEEAIAAAIKASSIKVPSAGSLSSSRSSSQPQEDSTKAEKTSIQPQTTSTYISFRELEQSELTHEGIAHLNKRLDIINMTFVRRYRSNTDHIVRPYNLEPFLCHDLMSRTNASGQQHNILTCLYIAYILRITKADGVWSLNTLLEKLDRLIKEVESLTRDCSSFPKITILKELREPLLQLIHQKQNNPNMLNLTVTRAGNNQVSEIHQTSDWSRGSENNKSFQGIEWTWQ